jgi:cell division protein FtsL
MSTARTMTDFQNYDDYRAYILKKNVEDAAFRHEAKASQKKQRHRFAVTLRIIAFSALLFAMLSVVVIRYADVYEAKYHIHAMTSEIKQIHQEIEEINASMDSTVSLENVERVAVQELKMQYPQPEQIVYLTSNWKYSLDSASKSDYVLEDRTTAGTEGIPN